MGNSTCIAQNFARLERKVSLMYRQRAYTHHLIAEGVQEGDIVNAIEDVNFLLADYEEIEMPVEEEVMVEE